MELKQTDISYYDKRLAGTALCSESTDAIVPDTFPDIGRVVCAYGTAAIKDQTPQNGRLLISGTVKTTVLYQPEDEHGMLRRLSIPLSFAHIEECAGLGTDAVCFAACRVAGVEAVPVNSRKLSVTAQLCFETEGYQRISCTVTEGVDLPSLQVRSTAQPVALIEQVQCTPITVLEDTPIPDAAGLELVHHSCTLRSVECRAMHGKVVLKGEAAVSCLALQEDGAVRVLTSDTPFTQIIELDGVEDNDTISTRLAVRELDCRLEADGLLSYTVGVAARLAVHRSRTVQQLNDLYLPGRALHLQQEQLSLRTMPTAAAFSAEVNETVQTAQHVSHIIASDAVCCGCKRAGEEALLLTAAVQVLYLNDAQQLCALHRTLQCTVTCAVKGTPQRLELVARAAPAGEQGMVLTLTLNGQSAEEAELPFRCITGMEAGEPTQAYHGVTLLLRYIDHEQSLWDIAKSCGATMDAIRTANEMPPDTQSAAHTMLLIPVQG